MSISRHGITAFLITLTLSVASLAAQSEIIKLEATASYYGKEFHGRPTSSGETFDMYAMTAAHKSLPFGTLLEVTNLANGKRVMVRVNDRGPFVENREIDLSYGAAEALGMIEVGVAKVSIRKTGMAATGSAAAAEPGLTATEPSTGNPSGLWRIQLASFSSEENAERMAAKLRSEGFNPELEKAGGYVRVILPKLRQGDLETVKARLLDRGYRDWLTKRENR